MWPISARGAWVLLVTSGVAIGLTIVPAQSQIAHWNCQPYLAQNKCPQIAICQNRTLADYDNRLSVSYKLVRSIIPGNLSQQLLVYQRAWIVDRDGCGCDLNCLASKYHSRVTYMEGLVAKVTQTQPGQQEQQRPAVGAPSPSGSPQSGGRRFTESEACRAFPMLC